MKFIHTSDLHLGKRVNDFSMIEDQRYILAQILEITKNEQPDAFVIAGDIYDKPVPPAEAVGLFDDFLTELSALKIPVLMVSGNHDSAERIAFGGRLMEKSNVFVSPVYDGKIEKVELSDTYGKVCFYLMPFLKPGMVRHALENDGITDYTEAMRAVIEEMNLDPAVRNVLVCHQFVTGAMRSESEEISVGGLDNVDAAVFAPFDYVAMGHIHGPQNIGSMRVRYSGTPLKYSFSEVSHHKSLTVVTLGEGKEISVDTHALTPKRDLRELKGTYEQLTDRRTYEGTNREDYIHVTLTDEQDVLDAMAKLRVIYPNLMKLDYDNTRTRENKALENLEQIERFSPMELIAKFYSQVNNQDLTDEMKDYMNQKIEQIWEGER